MKNVLIILTDQQRKDSLGCYGNAATETPNLDRLAGRSVQFDRAYVANPLCMPNRLSIFTGLYPRNHGTWTNGLLPPVEARTLADVFADAGYDTASFGKIHFTPYGGEAGTWESERRWKELGDDFDWSGPYWGFRHVELTIKHTAPLAHYGRWFRRNGGRPEMLALHPVSGAPESGVRSIPAALHDSTFIAERTVAFLERRREMDRPFLAVASFPNPHHPFDPPEEMAAKYPPDRALPPIGTPKDLATRPAHYTAHLNGAWARRGIGDALHRGGLPREQQQERICHTYAMVDLIDRSVGRILDALEREGLAEDTVVIFTSDHGELLGDHGLWLKGPFFYEGLINVPLLIHAPGLTPHRTDRLVSHVDLFPTVCDLADIKTPEGLDGLSHAPSLGDRGPGPRARCLIEYRNGYGDPTHDAKVLVSGAKKYVRYRNGEEELTDLKHDPAETTNLAAAGAGAPDGTAAPPACRLDDFRQALLDELLAAEPQRPRQISQA